MIDQQKGEDFATAMKRWISKIPPEPPDPEAVLTVTEEVLAEMEVGEEDHPNSCVKAARPPPLKPPDPPNQASLVETEK